MLNIIISSLHYFSTHPILNSLSHSLGGFGLAILLQKHIKGDVFVPTWVGWACLIFSIVIHAYSFM